MSSPFPSEGPTEAPPTEAPPPPPPCRAEAAPSTPSHSAEEMGENQRDYETPSELENDCVVDTSVVEESHQGLLNRNFLTYTCTDGMDPEHIILRDAVQPLIEMLQSPDVQLREMAAFALGRLAKVSEMTSIYAGCYQAHPRGKMQSQSGAVEWAAHVRQSDPTPTRASGPHSTQDNLDSHASSVGINSDSAPSTISSRGLAGGLKIASMPPGQKVEAPTRASDPRLTQDNPDFGANSGVLDSESTPSTISSGGLARGLKIAPMLTSQKVQAPTRASDAHLTQDNPESGTSSESAPSTIRMRGPARGLKIVSMPPGQKVQAPTRASDPDLRQDNPHSDASSGGMDTASASSTIRRRGPARGLKIVSMPTGQKVQASTRAYPHLTQDNPDSGASLGGMDADSASSTIRRRGRVRGLKIASMPKLQEVQVSEKEYGQLCNNETAELMTWIGTLARNTSLLPCAYPDWRKIPKEYKEGAWNKLKEKFKLDDDFKTWAFHKINDRWRDFKCHLKENIYDRYPTYQDRVQNRDERVPEEQWLDLLRMWDTESYKAMCQQNKINRSKVQLTHTAGKRSSAQVRKRKRKEHPVELPSSRLELLIDTHTRKDGSPVDITSERMTPVSNHLNEQPEETQRDNAVHEEILTEVMGDDPHSRVPLAGAGSHPRDLHGSSRKIAAFFQENAGLRTKVGALRVQVSSMQLEMNMVMQRLGGNQQTGT